MVKYIIATIAAALVAGVLMAFFPQAFISGEVSLLTVLGWVIIVMAWSFFLYLLNKREKNRKNIADKKKLSKKK